MFTPARLIWQQAHPSFTPQGGAEKAESAEKAEVAKIAEDFMRRLINRDRDVLEEFDAASSLFSENAFDTFNFGKDFKLLQSLVLDGKGSPKDRLRFSMETEVLTNPVDREKLMDTWVPRLDVTELKPENIAYVVRMPVEVTVIHQKIGENFAPSATETVLNHETGTVILALDKNKEVIAFATPSSHWGPTVERQESLKANAGLGERRHELADNRWMEISFLSSKEELQTLFGGKIDEGSVVLDHSRIITVDKPSVGVMEGYPVHYFRLTRDGKPETVAFVFGRFPLEGFIRLSPDEVDRVDTVDDLYRLKQGRFYALERPL